MAEEGKYNPYAGKNALKPDDIPSGSHWAIITFETYSESTGYEKAGEMGSRATKATYRVYVDRDAWEREIQELSRPKYGTCEPFVALANCTKATIETVVKVNIK